MRLILSCMMLGLSAASCGPTSDCILADRSSMIVLEEANIQDCDSFGWARDRNVQLLDDFVPDAAARLRGWTYFVHAFPWQYDPAPLVANDEYFVYGLTWCSSKTIEVSKTGDASWCHTALLHEMIHAVSCDDPKDSSHANWETTYKLELERRGARCLP